MDEHSFDVIVIGAGHAGCEAAVASARMGARTLLLTINADAVAKMSCNPCVGGLAKGQIAREIDALGGVMGRVIDETGIQFRMLNTAKGPAVRAPRAQADRRLYSARMKRLLEEEPNLTLRQGTAERIRLEKGRVAGVGCLDGTAYRCRSLIVTAGTFMRGLIHIGPSQYPGGRLGEPPSVGLSKALMELGIELDRLKTGTSPRLNGRTIDLGALEPQRGDDPPRPFSFSTERIETQQVPCYITSTTSRTLEVVRANLDRAPMYTGQISSKGPRYCPSFEDKVVRFADKERHQVFLEPEGLDTHEMYANGISTSLPVDVQEELVHSVRGLEKAEIVRYGYAIEYDFAPPTQLTPWLETKKVAGLFFAGQINGTSGYEEAGGQGLVAGVNAVLSIRGEAPFVLGRDEAYIGVLIDDLVTKGTNEPYRMFTSRAEYRLLLRQDNADRRLTPHGRKFGLVDDAAHARFERKLAEVEAASAYIAAVRKGARTLRDILKRPEVSWPDLVAMDEGLRRMGVSDAAGEQVEIEAKYEGYIERQRRHVRRAGALEKHELPADLDYDAILDISNEARGKLKAIRPRTLAQASRISGVNPADISVLMVALKGRAAKVRAKPE